MRLKISVISFLLLLILTSNVGYHCIFSYLQKEIKHHVLSELFSGRKKTFCITLSQQQFQQLKFENENEFIINGEWFDIANKKIIADKIILDLYPDNDETKLTASDIEHTITQSSTSSESSNSKTIQQNLISDFLVEHIIFQPLLPSVLIYFGNFSSFMFPHPIEYLTAPPEN